MCLFYERNFQINSGGFFETVLNLEQLVMHLSCSYALSLSECMIVR